jgi:hypothetical protein
LLFDFPDCIPKPIDHVTLIAKANNELVFSIHAKFSLDLYHRLATNLALSEQGRRKSLSSPAMLSGS